jgi:hypothetical protein
MITEITNLKDYISIIQEIHLQLNPKKNLFYRGVSKAKYDLKPNVYRNTSLNEREILIDYCHFLPRNAPVYDFPKDILRILTDMQHYGVPTRLLDWSMSPFTALYFACCKNSHLPTNSKDINENNGKLFVLNAWALWNRLIVDRNSSEIHQIHIKARALLSYYSFEEVKKLIKREFGFEINKSNLQLPFPFVASYSNNRIIAQKGCFTIHGINIDELAGKEIIELTIPRSCKDSIIKELNMFGIDDYLLFPDFEGMANSFKRKKSLFNL